MSEAPRLHRYTYADYVGLEMYSDSKHEIQGGRVEVPSLSTELVVDDIYRKSAVT